MIHKTLMMQVIEEEIKMDISVYLHRKMRAGWTLRRIAHDLGVSEATISVWTRKLGYSKTQASELAWENNLVGRVEMAAPRPRRPIRRVI